MQSTHIAGGVIGAGIDEMRWTMPVRPGDTLRTESEVLSVRPSKSRPEFGLLRSRTLVFNQRNEIVMTMIVNALAPVRNPPKA